MHVYRSAHFHLLPSLGPKLRPCHHPLLGWIFSHQLLQPRHSPTDMTTDQHNMVSPTLRLSSQAVTDFVKLITIANQHSSLKQNNGQQRLY